MAGSVALAQPYQESSFKRGLRLLPGLGLLLAVGYTGKLIERSITAYGRSHHMKLPNIEYVLWAILLGLLISNTVGIPPLSSPASQATNSGSKPELSCSASGFFWATC
jgi:hypothetical protein